GQGRARARLNGDGTQLFAVELISQKREGYSTEVGASSAAADDDIRIFPDHGELFLRLKSNHRLVMDYMVQHRTKSIISIRMCGRIFNRFRYRKAQTSWIVGVGFESFPA